MERPTEGDLEQSPGTVGTARRGCAIQIAIAGLHQTVTRIGAVLVCAALGQSRERVKRIENAARGYPEQTTRAVRAALDSRAVKIPVIGQVKTGLGKGAVRATGKRIKSVHRAVAGHLEN